MGLAGPKTRTKIGSDPNNTRWSKSTTRFGHKILTSQGWTPGATLGAENASHASHFTTASSSHIRVLLREDGLGLGAKNGRQDVDTFGLDMFQGLLGRLNGKSEELLRREEIARRDVKLREVAVKKMGGRTFVSGGFLVGDRIERVKPLEGTLSGDVGLVVSEDVEKERSKKRKRTQGDSKEIPASKSVTAGDELAPAESATLTKEQRRAAKKARKEKKTKRDAREADESSENAPELSAHQPVLEELSENELKRRRKADRREAKEQRRKAKEERRKRKEGADEEDVKPDSEAPTTSGTETIDNVASRTLQQTAAVARGRFAVRARHLQQKRMAFTDQQALKEIFMLKAGA